MTKKAESRIPLDDLLVFHQVARSLTSSFDLDTILRTIIEHMERFIEAELWTLLMLDEARQELYYAIVAGGEESALRGVRVKMGEGVAGWVVQHGETLLVPEAGSDPRVRRRRRQAATVRSVIALPLRGRKGTHGAIEIFNPQGRPAHRLHHRLSAHSGRPRGHRNRECSRRGAHPAVDHHRRLHGAL